MAHEIRFTIKVEKTLFLDRMRKKITYKPNNMFSGNQEKGNIKIEEQGMIVEGNYKIHDNECVLEITKKPLLVPFAMIENKIRKYVDEANRSDV